jgi:hypothetical protein
MSGAGRARAALRTLVLIAVAAAPALARAHAWTRDQGHFYLGTSWSRLATTEYYTADFTIHPIQPYEQNLVGIYGEVGILTRWLTATIEGSLYRRAEIKGQGYTEGLGDFRLGAWTGLLTKPVHLAFGVLLGLPTGDAMPSAGPNASGDAQLVARSLPTGDGEWDLEPRLSLGHSFGGARYWPVKHYLLAEAGYWLRTRGFADAFTWRVELGTQFPWKVLDRFWFVLRFTGVESFASAAEASRDATGLGNGVTYVAPGFDVAGRIWRGLGASIGADSAVRGRAVPAAVQLRLAVSYQY